MVKNEDIKTTMMRGMKEKQVRLRQTIDLPHVPWQPPPHPFAIQSPPPAPHVSLRLSVHLRSQKLVLSRIWKKSVTDGRMNGPTDG